MILNVKLVFVPLKNFVPSGDRFPMMDGEAPPTCVNVASSQKEGARFINSLIKIYAEFPSDCSGRRSDVLPGRQRARDPRRS